MKVQPNGLYLVTNLQRKNKSLGRRKETSSSSFCLRIDLIPFVLSGGGLIPSACTNLMDYPNALP